MTAKTAGQTFTASIVKMLHVGPRTRSRRDGLDLRTDILDTISNAVIYPGFENEQRTEALRPAFAAVNGYRKHIDGGRVDAIVCWYVREGLSPYQFVKLIGRMVDAKVSNMLEAEDFFKSLSVEANTAYNARY
jgi:hypothetical protein